MPVQDIGTHRELDRFLYLRTPHPACLPDLAFGRAGDALAAAGLMPSMPGADAETRAPTEQPICLRARHRPRHCTRELVEQLAHAAARLSLVVTDPPRRDLTATLARFIASINWCSDEALFVQRTLTRGATGGSITVGGCLETYAALAITLAAAPLASGEVAAELGR